VSLKSVKTLTASEIAKKWKLSQKTVNSLIDAGSKVEHEHDKDMKNAREIARDHISERPDYYKKLRKMEKSKISMKEGLSTEPERDSETIGDYTGASRKVMKVDEIRLPKVPEKVKKRAKNAAGTAATFATVMSGATAYDNASRNVGSPIKDVASVATGIPGKVGWAITPGSATINLANYIKSRKQAKKMEEQGSPANPARYTERPMYEAKRVRFISKQNPADLPPRPDDYKPGDFGSKLAREGGIKYPGKKKASRPVKEEVSDAQVDRYLKGIGGTESGGTKDPYTARSKRSSASGKYQFIDSTWRNVVRKYGSPGDVKKYPHASSAPPDYQEKVARSNAKGEIERYGERGAVLTHFTGNPAGKMGRAAQRANPGVTADTYYKRFQKFAGDVIGTKSASASDKPATSTAPKPEITNKPPETPKTPEVAKTPETTSKNFGVSFASNDVAKKMSAPQTPDTSSSSNYTIRKGDTLSDIAKSHHTDVNTIAKASHISDPNKIYPGQKIKFDEAQIDELKAETLGSYISKSAKSRKKSLEGPKSDIKTWAKREHGIRTAIKKLTKEETTMDTKDLINEALDDILENNLVSMKENLMYALQEKAMEKLEEKKKDIASSYFAQ
jgi:LysM repeat protein